LPFPDEIADGNDQNGNNHSIEFAAGIVSNALAAIDFFGRFDAFGCEFKCPRKEHSNWQPDSQTQHEDLHHPFRGTHIFEHQVSELQNQPCHHDIGDTYAKNVTSLEFLDQSSHQFGFLTDWEAKIHVSR